MLLGILVITILVSPLARHESFMPHRLCYLVVTFLYDVHNTAFCDCGYDASKGCLYSLSYFHEECYRSFNLF